MGRKKKVLSALEMASKYVTLSTKIDTIRTRLAEVEAEFEQLAEEINEREDSETVANLIEANTETTEGTDLETEVAEGDSEEATGTEG